MNSSIKYVALASLENTLIRYTSLFFRIGRKYYIPKPVDSSALRVSHSPLLHEMHKIGIIPHRVGLQTKGPHSYQNKRFESRSLTFRILEENVKNFAVPLRRAR
jgi:hypothetical protein